MTTTTYGGKLESPGKAKARSWGYALLKRPDLYQKHHIVIASRDCGDIRYLLGLGVEPNRIVACDIDPVARAMAKQYGVTVSPHPRIEDTVKWAQAMGWALGSVNVDLCCSLLDAAPIAGAVLGVLQGTVLALLTYRRGRDATVLGCRPEEMPDTSRMEYLAVHTKCKPNATETYHSFTRTNQGSAMGVAAFFVKGKPGRKAKVQAPEKQYLCHKCKRMGAHPMKHRKVCPGPRVEAMDK